jgi:hypothetical protein
MKTKQTAVYGIFAIIFALTFAACDSGTTGGSSSNNPGGQQPGGEQPPAHTHQWGAWTVITAATCVTTGVETRTCSLDVSHIEQRETSTDSSAHNWEWALTKAPTDTVDGTEAGVCKNDSSHGTTRPAYATGTAGLAFEAINNNTAYRVRKGTAVTTGVLNIPTMYRPNADSDYLPVTEIGSTGDSSNSNAAFYNTTITSVTIPETVTTIGSYAFSGCDSLTTITIPASVTEIGSYAFSGFSYLGLQSKLATVTFAAGSKLKTIGSSAFVDNVALTAIIIPASVTEIDSGAFSGCTTVATVTFAQGSQLQTIGVGAFANTVIASITIPAGVTSIGEFVFSGCTTLTSINVVTANPNYTGANGILYNKTRTTLIRVPEGISSSVTIPDTVTSIGGSAFSGCTSINNAIVIPAGVTSIGGYAFYGWGNTQTINVRGHKNQAAADAAWGGANWRSECQAGIKYWDGTSYQ